MLLLQFAEASETDHPRGVNPKKKIVDAKLAKDFQAVLKEFQKAQRLAAERETVYAPLVPKPSLPYNYTTSEVDVNADKHLEQRAVLVESKREQGIQEIQQQIGEVHEIFKDLAVLVHDQGTMIDDIGTHIDNSHAATAQGNTHLAKASKTQKIELFSDALALGDFWYRAPDRYYSAHGFIFKNS
ncbi:unnamed protein product [Arabis nemorensis]|uniref:t-SNARE coiled-coil homology domain-containing protein n=1 Tax=Arabis nemorensis TaxID=586526 RepID=A0A565CGB3_9BRAS|nr:unnamed protein product [Arabis nemorensis]